MSEITRFGNAHPTVMCVMLVNGREQMAKRAVASFCAQTYEPSMLFILDTGKPPLPYRVTHQRVFHIPPPGEPARTEPAQHSIGYLRNFANDALRKSDLIAHFDSDDWSHPRRLEEQVALLQASGKQCVSYRELLFWDTREACPADCEEEFGHLEHSDGEAWLYRNPDPRWGAGASFLYRRELWERQPFEDAPHEDQRWWCTPLVSANCRGVSAQVSPRLGSTEPRMICQMHAGSTEHIPRKVMLEGGGGTWRRVPEWDSHCRSVMAL
jgi:hypothetical protein